MAWEAISKQEVANISGTDINLLEDVWYDMAVDLIGRHAGIYNIGIPTATTEVHVIPENSDIFLYRPPVISITSITIDSELVDVDYYRHDKRRIIFDSDFVRDHAGDLATIVYSSGSSESDYAVALTIALVVKEIGNLRTMEGSHSLVQFYRPGQSRATEMPLYQWGSHGKIIGIIGSLLGRRFNIR